MPRNDTDFDDSLTDGQDEARPLAFGELGVPGPLVRVLAADDKKTAFPIQADTLPDSLAGRDILGRGRTGSGKTLAFSIPLVARLGDYDSFDDESTMSAFRREIKRRRQERLEERLESDFLPHPRGLVLAPTRELANQINDVLMPLAQMYGMTTTTIYGGVNQKRQVRDLRSGADIMVACPGRLEDLLRQGLLTLESVEVVVIDEADEMADMGFLPPVKRLLAQIAPDAQHMLFSATLDHGVDEVVNEFLHDPKVHSVDSATAEPDLMTHHVFETTRADKHELVRTLASGEGRRILFTRTKFQAKKLAKNLTQNGIPAAELHGNLNQNQRDRNLAAFESGDVRVMVATDVAARGIDVSGVELVVQVEPPEDPKSFLHRSGRTARAGREGDVVTLVLPEQRREARRMLKIAGIKVKPIEVTHDSPEVLELVGERAERVDGWSLEQSQPAGRQRRGGTSSDDGEGRGRKRRRNRGAGAGAGRAAGRRDGADRGRGDVDRMEAATATAADRAPANRADRRAGLRDRDAERRDLRFEQGEAWSERASERDSKRAERDSRADRSDRSDRADRRGRGGRFDRSERPARKRETTGRTDMPETRGEMTSDFRGGSDSRRTKRDFSHKDRSRAERSYDGRRSSAPSSHGAKRGGEGGGKRIHRKDENRIVRDERSEDAKRHDRRMIARYGNTEGPHRRHSKTKSAPFRMPNRHSGRR